MFGVGDVSSVLPPGLNEACAEHALAGAFLPAQDDGGFGRFGWLLEHPGGRVEEEVEMVAVAAADDLEEVVVHKAPVAGVWFDTEPAPQIPVIRADFAGRIEDHAAEVLTPPGMLEPEIPCGFVF